MWRLGVSSIVLFASAAAAVQATQAPVNVGKLWKEEPDAFVCADRRPGASGFQEGPAFDSVSERPYVLTRLERKTLSGSDSPVLTVTSDPDNRITILGKTQPDFSMQYCGRGGGSAESEARQSLGEVGMTLDKDVVTLNNPGLPGRHLENSFFLEAPSNARIVTHASYSSVEVRNMSGPVRIAGVHGRATILNTTGQVDVEAEAIDFAGSRGRVQLSATAEIELAMPAKFDGTLAASSNKSVHLQIPSGFRTPFRVIVDPGNTFVCRVDICSKMKETKQGQLRIYTYAGDGSTAPDLFWLRAESYGYSGNGKIVIDAISDVTVKILDSGPAAPKE